MSTCIFAPGCFSVLSDRLDAKGTAMSCTRNSAGKLVSTSRSLPVKRGSSWTSSICGNSGCASPPTVGTTTRTQRPRSRTTSLFMLIAVPVEELVEAVHAQRGVHRRVVCLHVHGAGEDRERFALHHELVDAAELLLGDVLARLRDEEAVELVRDLGVAALQVDVLERVEGEVLRDDPLHGDLAHLGGHEVVLRGLDLVVAGEDADLVVDVVALVANLADLVRDPELEPLGALRRQELDDVLLLAVLEDEAHEALGDRRLLVGLARLAEGLLDEAGVLRLLLRVLVLRLDERVVELAAARVLVLLQEVPQIADEGVELRAGPW